jgi:long-subunit fatty acid transport protein
MRRVALGSCAVGLALAAQAGLAPEAHAGGFELSGVGTRGMGRGGAFAARVDDSLALALNPAMLADADAQVVLNAHLVIWDACVDRVGTYAGELLPGEQPYTGGGTIFAPNDGVDPSTWASQDFPRVCNGGAPQIAPQLMANVRLTDEVGLGFGIVAPNGTGTARFGNEDGTVSVGGQRLPTPNRYMVTAQDLILFFPSVGVGYRPVDWLRIGLTLQWGVGIISFTNYTNSGTAASGVTGTIVEDPAADIRTRLNVVDPFVPAGVLSVHLVPHDNFEIMASARISDSIGGVVDASGTLELTTGAYGTGADGSYVPTTTTIQGASLHAGQPFQFSLAMRYADRIRPRTYRRTAEQALSHRIEDGMQNENFDVELDVVYEQLSQVTDFVVRMPGGSSAQLRTPTTTDTVPIPQPLPIPHGWSDVLTLRLGGDVNVIPGTLAVRAGASFELPVDDRYKRYLQNDFIGGWRLGLHAGATLRVERFDISLAYGFFLGESVNVTNPGRRQINALQNEGVCADSAAYDPSRPVPSRGCYPNGFGALVNGGTFSQMFHVVSLGASYHFE